MLFRMAGQIFVTSTRLTDGRTDGRTNGRTDGQLVCIVFCTTHVSIWNSTLPALHFTTVTLTLS